MGTPAWPTVCPGPVSWPEIGGLGSLRRGWQVFLGESRAVRKAVGAGKESVQRVGDAYG